MYSKLVSSVNSQVGQVEREHSRIKTGAEKDMSKTSGQLGDQEPALSRGAIASAKHTKQYEEMISAIEGKFDIDSLEAQKNWNADELSKHQKQMQETVDVVDKAQKFTEEYAGKASKIGS